MKLVQKGLLFKSFSIQMHLRDFTVEFLFHDSWILYSSKKKPQ